MHLKEFSYSEFRGEPKEWVAEPMTFGNVNLLVGRNASGKTRTLNVIAALGKLLSGRRPQLYTHGAYLAKFDANEAITYELRFRDSKVEYERLVIDTTVRMERGPDGSGSIYSEESKSNLSIKSPPENLVVVSRRDAIQHSFFEPIFDWASHFQHCHFVIPPSVLPLTQFDLVPTTEQAFMNDRPDEAISWYVAGFEKHGAELDRRIVEAMNQIGFPIKQVDVEPIVARVGSNPLVGFVVDEAGLACRVEQPSMSAGMYRTLALVARVCVAELAEREVLLLIDDIAEGLDFQRARGLIQYVTQVANRSRLQVIMSSNDQFVMNSVPLDCWSIVIRQGSTVRLISSRTSPDLFHSFETYGLSNFDFFSKELYLQ